MGEKVQTAASLSAIEEAILFIASLENLVLGLANGLNASDLTNALALIKTVPAVFSDGLQIIPEFVELDDAQRASLVDFVTQNVALPENVSVEKYTQLALKALINLSSLVSLFQKK